MTGDLHVHSHYSADSEADMEEEVKKAIALGLPFLAFTDHIDWDHPQEGNTYDFDVDKAMREIGMLKEKYSGKIQLLKGVELGMQPSLSDRLASLLEEKPFDFVIGSRHLVGGIDPYYPEAFEGRRDADVYRAYFEDTLDNILAFHAFDTLGHLDYVVRYGTHKEEAYSYQAFADIIDEILKTLIRYDRALEINTGGFRKGLGAPNPHPDILRRYRELGGRLITLGSDAHSAEDIGSFFGEARTLLLDAGFKETVYFKDRKPYFVRL